MKTITTISILLILCFFGFELYSQNYKPFIKENARWECVFSNPYEYTMKTFYFDGVEPVNDTLYHKVYYQYFNTTTNQQDSIFYCLLREENKKVYTRVGNQEILFCNFDLQINDTLDYNYIVQSTDSICLYQSYRKRWRISYFDEGINDYSQTYIIEGIGSTSGFEHFYNSECFPSNYTCTHLLNYYENNLIFSNTLLTNIEHEIKKYEDLTIFPNPIINQSQINIASNQIYSIEFYNILGLRQNIVLKSNLIEKKNFQTTGVYFITITTINGQIFKRKIIIE